MVFVEKYRIEHRIDDIACQSRFLSSNSLNSAPMDLSLNMWRNMKVAIFGKVTIYFQELELYCFNPVIGTDGDKLLHQFR